MKRLIFKYLSIICCTLAVSCTYEYEADIPTDNNIVVIDGRIVTGITSTITISKATKLDGSAQYGSISAKARLECEDGTIIEGYSEGGYSGYPSGYDDYYPGIVSNPTISFDTKNLDPTKKYKVFIDAGDEGTFESDWLEVYKAPVIDALTYNVVDGEDGKALDFRVSAHADSPYFAVSYVEAWEHTSLTTTMLEYFPETNTVDEASWKGREHPYYRCWQESDKPITVISSAAHTENKIENAYLTKLGQYNLKVSVLYRMIVNVSSTSKEYYDYWDNLRKVSYVDGDLFTPIPSNMEGNVHRKTGNGTVIGFLGASEAAVDTIYYKNRGFYRWPREYATRLDELMYYHMDMENPSDLNQYYCPLQMDWAFAYSMGNVPIREASGEEGFIPNMYVWGRKECVDCRYLGGDIKFPEDWPDRNDPNL